MTTRQPSGERLPDRVWGHLNREGPSYPHALALALNARDAAVSGALSSLLRRGRAAIAYRHGRRIYYEALCGRMDALSGLGVELVDLANHSRHHGPAPEQLRPLADGQSALELECALLRAALPSFEVEAVIAGNRPVRGL